MWRYSGDYSFTKRMGFDWDIKHGHQLISLELFFAKLSRFKPEKDYCIKYNTVKIIL